VVVRKFDVALVISTLRRIMYTAACRGRHVLQFTFTPFDWILPNKNPVSRETLCLQYFIA